MEFLQDIKGEKKALARALGGEGKERRSTRRVSANSDPDGDMTILRRREVERRTGLSRSTLYELIEKAKFPRPIRLGPRAVGWLASEIETWVYERIAERDTVSEIA